MDQRIAVTEPDPMETSDADLIHQFRTGNQEAFGHLVNRWQGKAYALAYRLTLDAADSEDIRQQAFLKIQNALDRFAIDQAKFSTWLYRIILNLCRDRHRSNQTRSKALQDLTARPAAALTGTLRETNVPTAGLETTERNRRIAQAMIALPLAIQEVVIMRHYQGLKFAQIAEILDSPVSTVKSRLTLGLSYLRQELEDLAP